MNETLVELAGQLRKKGCYDTIIYNFTPERLGQRKLDNVLARKGKGYGLYFIIENHSEHDLTEEAQEEFDEFKRIFPQADLTGFVYNGIDIRGLR